MEEVVKLPVPLVWEGPKLSGPASVGVIHKSTSYRLASKFLSVTSTATGIGLCESNKFTAVLQCLHLISLCQTIKYVSQSPL